MPLQLVEVPTMHTPASARRRDPAVLTLPATLDGLTTPTLLDQVTLLLVLGMRSIVLDMSATTSIDPMGASALIALQRRARLGHGHLRVDGMRPEVRGVLRIADVDGLFGLVD